MRQAVILAGGKGTRLASRLNGRPKPLIDVDGRPLLERQLDSLYAAGFREVLLLVQHAKEQIEEFTEAYDQRDMEIRLIEDGEPRGTGGSVLAAWDHLDEVFLVVYGDTLFDINFPRFIKRHLDTGAQATLFVHPNDHPYDSDIIGMDEDGWVTGFHPAPHPSGQYLRNLVNAALYVVKRESLTHSRDLFNCDFIKHIFPRLLDAGGRILAYPSVEYIKDIGTPDRLDKAVKHLRDGKVIESNLNHKQKTIFLDRDGTLNIERGLIRNPSELELMPGAAQAVRAINQSGYRSMLITNQPVIARGEVTKEGLMQIHTKLEADLGFERAFLDAIYYCPHHPDKGYPGEIPEMKMDCGCRKPQPGLLLQAAAEHNIDLSSSWIIGDSGRDILAGEAAGVSTVLVGSGLEHEVGKFASDPDFRAANIELAVNFILSSYPRLATRFAKLISEIEAGSLVLVGGLTSSGKTSFASLLVRELRKQGKAAMRLGLDGYHFPVNEQSFFDTGIDRYDTSAALEAITPWLSGGALAMNAPLYDHALGHLEPDARAVALQADGTLVMEGVPAFTMTPDTNRPVVRLYIECNEEARQSRLLHAQEGQKLNDTHKKNAVNFSEVEEANFSKLKDFADKIIDISMEMNS